MQYREIIAACSEIHTKHINTLCVQNVELLNVKPGGTYWSLHTGVYRVDRGSQFAREEIDVVLKITVV
jgi:hypothetical protein